MMVRPTPGVGLDANCCSDPTGPKRRTTSSATLSSTNSIGASVSRPLGSIESVKPIRPAGLTLS